MTASIRYGVVGAGMMGREHIGNLAALDGAVLTAMADPYLLSLDEAWAVAPEPKPALFESLTKLVDSGLCDAVVVASPNHAHFSALMELLPTDLHILMEKPLCSTVEDCLRVREAARGREALVWVGMEYRYMPAIARLIRETDRGTAGDLKMLTVREHRFPFLPKVGDWNRWNANTGGTLVEKCCHHFDLMNRILGERPVAVFASGAQDVNHLDERYGERVPDILDNAYVILDYPGGRRAMLELCMFAEGGRNQEEVTAVGDQGKIEAHIPSNEVAIGGRGEPWFSPRVEKVTDPRIAYQGHHYGASYLEHLDFRDAILGNGASQVSIEDGLWAVAMGAAAQLSIAENRPVAMTEILPDHPL